MVNCPFRKRKCNLMQKHASLPSKPEREGTVCASTTMMSSIPSMPLRVHCTRRTCCCSCLCPEHAHTQLLLMQLKDRRPCRCCCSCRWCPQRYCCRAQDSGGQGLQGFVTLDIHGNDSGGGKGLRVTSWRNPSCRLRPLSHPRPDVPCCWRERAALH